jgi:hypothetical protein
MFSMSGEPYRRSKRASRDLLWGRIISHDTIGTIQSGRWGMVQALAWSVQNALVISEPLPAVRKEGARGSLRRREKVCCEFF